MAIYVRDPTKPDAPSWCGRGHPPGSGMHLVVGSGMIAIRLPKLAGDASFVKATPFPSPVHARRLVALA